LVAPDGLVACAIRVHADGREGLALTMAHDEDLPHTLLLGYGLVVWVTRGIFLGQRRTHLSIEVDDIFGATQLWDVERQSVSSGPIYRLTSRDIHTVLSWLDHVRRCQPNAANLELDLAFNGGAANAENDPLVGYLLKNRERFRWLNHTFSHQLLNDTSFVASVREIQRNQGMAEELALQRYDADSVVTPDLSGLTNTQFMRAAREGRVRFLVSDTSRPGWDNPTFNTGIISPLEPEVLIVPRHPTNLFYNVSLPEEWVAEYNLRYRSYWQRDLTYDEILDEESEAIFGYLRRGDIDPLMFHQANLRTYDGRHSLLSDLMDCVLAKYNAAFGDVPICCLSLHDIGEAMAARAAYENAAIQAALVVGSGLVLATDRDVVIPITGVRVRESSEWYGSQYLSLLALPAPEGRTVKLSQWPGRGPAVTPERDAQ
jgi:hypothetical protein